MVETLFLFSLHSIGLRWFLFDYKKTGFIREFLQRQNSQLLQELTQCVYCQTIEASILVLGLYWVAGLHLHPVLGGLACLTNGLIGIAADYWINFSIDLTEEYHDFPLTFVKDEEGNAIVVSHDDDPADTE